MYNNKFPYTDYSQLNLDFILDELTKKLDDPIGKQAGYALMIDNDLNVIWSNPAEVTSVNANNVLFVKTGTIFTKEDVQQVLQEVSAKLQSLQNDITARPIKSIRLNNVPITPDANGVVNIQIPDGNNIYY